MTITSTISQCQMLKDPIAFLLALSEFQGALRLSIDPSGSGPPKM
jgi:hypothetical protein